MLKPYTSRHSLLVVLFGLLSLLSGCAGVGTNIAYEGERLPDNKVAIIKPDAASSWTNVGVNLVDGKDMGGCGPLCAVEMLPGRHQIEIGWLYSGWLVPTYYVGTIEFDAIAGREYVLRASMVKGQPFVWLEDKATNKVVGRTVASKLKKKGKK
jgi:hypothetical protein